MLFQKNDDKFLGRFIKNLFGLKRKLMSRTILNVLKSIIDNKMEITKNYLTIPKYMAN